MNPGLPILLWIPERNRVFFIVCGSHPLEVVDCARKYEDTGIVVGTVYANSCNFTHPRPYFVSYLPQTPPLKMIVLCFRVQWNVSIVAEINQDGLIPVGTGISDAAILSENGTWQPVTVVGGRAWLIDYQSVMVVFEVRRRPHPRCFCGVGALILLLWSFELNAVNLTTL